MIEEALMYILKTFIYNKIEIWNPFSVHPNRVSGIIKISIYM